MKGKDIIADLQLHSRFSRAVSKAMTIQNIDLFARKKGIGLVATGDWTHPLWLREIEKDLEEVGNGLLRLKKSEVLESGVNAKTATPSPHFMLATEVSSIYKQGGKVRRVHTLIWVPSIASAQKIAKEMTKRGCNLLSDGRPIIGLTSIQVAELVFEIDPTAIIIPAHAWTPWFAVFGSMSGFDSLSEAFGPYADRIYAVETGLSSNPAMNWRIQELDSRSIVSFSDAHSGPKLGREATIFRFPDGIVSFNGITEALKNVKGDLKKPHIAYTIEFYPEEGKYHYTGHRTCGIRYTPEETEERGTTCPVCGKPLTVGVMHRMNQLATRTDTDIAIQKLHVSSIPIEATLYGSSTLKTRPPFIMLVPLMEIIAEVIGSPVTSPKVEKVYVKLLQEIGPDFFVLLKASLSSIEASAGSMIAEGIDRVRKGDIFIDPGFDGVFGVVKIWKSHEAGLVSRAKEQLLLLQ